MAALLLLLPLVACQKVQDPVSPNATAQFSQKDCLDDPDLDCFLSLSSFEANQDSMEAIPFQTEDSLAGDYHFFFPVPAGWESRELWRSATQRLEINWYSSETVIEAFTTHIHPDQAGAGNTFTAKKDRAGEIFCESPPGGCFSNHRPLSPIYPVARAGFDSLAYHIIAYLN